MGYRTKYGAIKLEPPNQTPNMLVERLSSQDFNVATYTNNAGVSPRLRWRTRLRRTAKTPVRLAAQAYVVKRGQRISEGSHIFDLVSQLRVL